MEIPVSLIQVLWPAVSDKNPVFTGYRGAIARSQFCYVDSKTAVLLGGFPAIRSIPQLQASVIVSVISNLALNQHPQS